MFNLRSKPSSPAMSIDARSVTRNPRDENRARSRAQSRDHRRTKRPDWVPSRSCVRLQSVECNMNSLQRNGMMKKMMQNITSTRRMDRRLVRDASERRDGRIWQPVLEQGWTGFTG